MEAVAIGRPLPVQKFQATVLADDDMTIVTAESFGESVLIADHTNFNDHIDRGGITILIRLELLQLISFEAVLLTILGVEKGLLDPLNRGGLLGITGGEMLRGIHFGEDIVSGLVIAHILIISQWPIKYTANYGARENSPQYQKLLTMGHSVLPDVYVPAFIPLDLTFPITVGGYLRH